MSKNNQPSTSSGHSLIAVGTKITGKIESSENIRIDGSLEGDIECKGKVILGASSNIIGNIDCNDLELMGKMKGNILCNNSVICRSKSKLEGDMKTKILEIEAGAEFTGAIGMVNASAQNQQNQ